MRPPALRAEAVGVDLHRPVALDDPRDLPAQAKHAAGVGLVGVQRVDAADAVVLGRDAARASRSQVAHSHSPPSGHGVPRSGPASRSSPGGPTTAHVLRP